MKVSGAVAGALDRVAFAAACGFVAEPWQERVLRSDERRLMLLTSRQSGKSELCALFALHEAIYNAESLSIIVSPSERQSVETFRKMQRHNRRLGKPVRADSETTTQLQLENGSRILALPSSEHTIRGFSAPSLVVMDEASRIPDTYLHSVWPMLSAAPNARIILASTPLGPSGFFFDLWERGEGWERFRVPAPDVPHISPSMLREAERTLPSWAFRSEYLCEFSESHGDAAFAVEIVAAAIDEEMETWTLGGI